MTDIQSLDDQAIVDYLRSNPAFFHRHAALLSELDLPHDSGKAVSLIERQVAVLRDRNMAMRRRMNDLLQAARDNDTLFSKTRSLTLAMLDVASWHELNEVLATNMLVDFAADFVCCHVTGRTVALDHIVSHREALPSDRFTKGTSPVCLTLRGDEMQTLFPTQQHDEPGSVVLIPLRLEQPDGCLAVGSRDPRRYSPEMDTLFANYIGDVLARIVDRL